MAKKAKKAAAKKKPAAKTKERPANKSELVELIFSADNKPFDTKSQAEKAVDAVLKGMQRAIESRGGLQIIGFGSFVVRLRKERMGRNPRTRKEMVIPASKTVNFRCGKALKDAINV